MRFKEMLEKGLNPDVVTYDTPIEYFGKIDKVAKACSLFDETLAKGCSPNIVTYNILFDCLERSGRTARAVKLYTKLKQQGLSPDSISYAMLEWLQSGGRRKFGVHQGNREVDGGYDSPANPIVSFVDSCGYKPMKFDMSCLKYLSLAEIYQCDAKIAASIALASILKILDPKSREIPQQLVRLMHNLSFNSEAYYYRVSLQGIIPALLPFLKNGILLKYCICILKSLLDTEEDKQVAILEDQILLSQIIVLQEQLSIETEKRS
ncbi:hypothetical protein K1719_024317 [Acacia pycnantha]|nr:hypothetical protein K1719_024317 [Acacia pycnantha]